MQKPEIWPMFTGIIESLGEIREAKAIGTNIIFWVESGLSSELKVDQSLAHDGVCLTVEEIKGKLHRVTAVAETLGKSNLGGWKPGRFVNLERSLSLSARLDGHFVQGHIDATGKCLAIGNKDGSYEMEFSFPEKFAALMIEKGSVCVNGISLTAWDVSKNSFKVAIIPYTVQHTNLQHLNVDERVNLEFDMIGKYILRKMNL